MALENARQDEVTQEQQGEEVQDKERMPTSALFAELARDVGFDEEDNRRLVEVAPLISPLFGFVVDRFYEVIRRNPSMHRVFEDEDQIERQKIALTRWLHDVFGGVYDDAYIARHAHIGRVHLRIGLRQRYMLSMMSVLRAALEEALNQVTPDWTSMQRRATRHAVHRILDLELAVMLDTYGALYRERIRANERLVTLGQLAASIGHDLRNPLAVIDSSAHLLMRRDLDERSARHARRIKEHADLCAKIVHGLMELARDRPILAKHQSLAQVVRKVLRGNEVDLELAETFAAVDDTLIGQVLVNLVENARQAGATHIVVHLREVGDEAVLTVDDDGPGIEQEILTTLFEPLISAREGGVGLGLALCARIVTEHGGTIKGTNKESGGASFVVRLPLSRG